MKNRKKLKLTLMILICVLITLIGFIGIYTRQANNYSNIMPDYKLASDLKGSTVLELEVDDSTNTIYYDSEGKKVDSSEVTEENEDNYTTKEVKVNSEEFLNEFNYKKSVDIMKKRLNFLQTDQYNLDLDTKTGKIVLTFEDDYPDDIKSILPMEGKLELVDSNSEDVILDYDHIKSAETTYASTEDGYFVYMTLKLNNTGIEKVNSFESYKKTTDDNGEVTTNKFKVQFDGDEIEEVSYDDLLLSGKTLRITLLSKETDESTVNSTLNTAMVVSKLATMGKMPVVYNIEAEEYVKPTLDMNIFYGMIIACIALVLVISIALIIKHKSNGILAFISTLAIVALFTILVRLTKTTISLNSFAGILVLIILNSCLVINILKNMKNRDKTIKENIGVAYLKTIDVLIVSLIIFAVFSFSKMTVISSMGLLLFWGWSAVVIGNLLLTVPMLAIKNKE